MQASSETNLISLTGENESLEMHTILEEELKPALPFASLVLVSRYSVCKAYKQSSSLLFTYFVGGFLFVCLVGLVLVLDKVSLLHSSGMHYVDRADIPEFRLLCLPECWD